MSGWSATAYLNEGSVHLIEKGLLGSIFSGGFKKGEKDKQSKELEFPYAIGTMVRSPFGEGVVSRPLSVEKGNKNVRTIGISITEWTLANETHPILYCTVETAQKWKNMKLNKEKNHLFSVFGTIVSETMRKFTTTPGPVATETKTSKSRELTFERYFMDGTSVSTSFGDGKVLSFREKDGFYEVYLTSWKQKGSTSPNAYLVRDALSYRLAPGCSEGYPVLTKYGLSGILASFEPTTGVHIVTIPTAGMVCYLQPDQIVRPLKAAVGEAVLTPYGEGTVVNLRIVEGIYEIKMKGWNSVLFTIGEAFDRVDDGIKNSDGPFGINWLLRWMFFSSESNKGNSGSQRSRSSSITSISARSINR